MEAWRFGFADMAPAFKFDPTDADIVAFYLLPRALGLDNPHGHAIIDDDPMSLPPEKLLEKHGHGASDQAFFFGPSPASRNRTVGCEGGGMWRGQGNTVGTVTLFSDGGGDEVDISYRRYNLSYRIDGEASPSGWVMSEYQITSPPLSSTVLTRIGWSLAMRGQRKRQPAHTEALVEQGPDKMLADAAAAAAEHQQVSPEPVQLGPDAQPDHGALDYGDTIGTGVEEIGGYYTAPLLLDAEGQEYKDKSRAKRRRYGS